LCGGNEKRLERETKDERIILKRERERKGNFKARKKTNFKSTTR
jgi:hypothetical protein